MSEGVEQGGVCVWENGWCLTHKTDHGINEPGLWGDEDESEQSDDADDGTDEEDW